MATKTATTDTQRGNDEHPSVSYWTDTTEGSTFESDKLRWWTESHLQEADRILNPCAGVATLDVDAEVIRVDVNENANADLYIDFRNLPEHVEPESFDGIVYDPPYTPNQARKKYGLDISDDEFYFYDREVKELFDRLLAPGGVIIQFGYTTEVMPQDLGYETLSIGLFNKLGTQNDYLGVAARKPTQPTDSAPPIIVSETVEQNAGAENIEGGNISIGGNGGNPIEMVYRRSDATSHFNEELSQITSTWISPSDKVLHIYEDKPRINEVGENYTTCRYDCIDLTTPESPTDADVIETPWNISSKFATGVFDVVILDIPYSAFQRTIRTPQEEASSGSDRTHIATCLKRGLTDLVNGNGGRVIQIGRTATLMSGQDYNYHRRGVGILRHPTVDYDQIISVDEKPHENLEVAGLGNGEVDRVFHHPHGTPDITSKHRRTDFAPTSDSEFCIHCGNGFFHHKAIYVPCPKCGAAAGTLCVDEDSNPFHPTGSDHRITQADIHSQRLERAEEKHSGDCNSKTPSYIEASPERVNKVLEELADSGITPDDNYGFLETQKIKKHLETNHTNKPRSTDVIEQVLDNLTTTRNDEQGTPTVQKTQSTKTTKLADFA